MRLTLRLVKGFVDKFRLALQATDVSGCVTRMQKIHTLTFICIFLRSDFVSGVLLSLYRLFSFSLYIHRLGAAHMSSGGCVTRSNKWRQFAFFHGSSGFADGSDRWKNKSDLLGGAEFGQCASDLVIIALAPRSDSSWCQIFACMLCHLNSDLVVSL